MHERKLPLRFPADQKVLDDIQQFKWHVVLIPQDNEGPAFAFTVGLYESFNHPEIIIFGLPLDSMHAILNNVGSDVQNGLIFQAELESDEILEGFSCQFIQVAPAYYEEYLGTGIWFYQDSHFPALQLVWPDRQGNYPWQADFETRLLYIQPLLLG